jgi:hypothetical protein
VRHREPAGNPIPPHEQYQYGGHNARLRFPVHRNSDGDGNSNGNSNSDGYGNGYGNGDLDFRRDSAAATSP